MAPGLYARRIYGVAAVLAALGASLAWSPDLHAQGTPTSANDKVAADVLFQQGKKLMKQNKYAEACPKFAESIRLDTGIGTMLWLADCYEKSGMTASAWAEFREAAGMAARDNDSREKVARERASALAPKLSTLVIAVSSEAEVPGLEVKRDGSVVGKALWGTKVPIDPGTHIVTATAPNKKPWETAIEVPAKPGNLDVAVIPLEDAESEQAPPPPHAPLLAAREDSGDTQRVAGLIAGGVGVVGLGVGVYFGLLTKSKLDDSNANNHCKAGNVCDAVGVEARSDAKGAGAISTTGFILGIIGLGGGAALYFTAPRRQSRRAASTWIAPSLGAQGAGLDVGGAW